MPNHFYLLAKCLSILLLTASASVSTGQTIEGTNMNTSPQPSSFSQQKVRYHCQTADCAAYLYLPNRNSTTEKLPAIAMAPGIGSLKEMGLLPYAEAFAKSGFVVLLFDFRHWGESGGEPREQALPQSQIDDYRHALTYLSTRPEVDERRLGLWGSSFSGGHVLQVAALDERVKAIVSQTPPTDLHALTRSRGTKESQQLFFKSFALERKRFQKLNAPQYIPIAAIDRAGGAMMGDDSYYFQEKMKEQYASHFINRISVDSLEAIYEYAPILWIPRIQSKPLLIINATEDTIVDPASVRKAFELANSPKKLHEISTGHYGVYEGEHRQNAITEALSWFHKYL